MVMVAPVPFVPYRAFDDDADPLAGGALYAFAAGTDTPLQTYADPQGLTLNPHPVVLDDAGYAHVYLAAGVPYKLRLADAQGVQQWEVDQVYGGGGGSGLTGLGVGSNTLEVPVGTGATQTVGVVFPAGVLAIALTVWVATALGTSQGLTAVGIGTALQPDCWGVLRTFSADTATTAGVFLAYGGQPQPQAGPLQLTAYGGPFDGTGVLYVTGHFFTFRPAQQVGMSYPASGPVQPLALPPATETTPGILPLATTADTSTGTNDTDAVTPFKLKLQLDPLRAVDTTLQAAMAAVQSDITALEATDATLTTTLALKVPNGPPLSVTRYSATGDGLQATPGLTTTSDGRLGVGAPPESGIALQVQGALRGRQGDVSLLRDDGASLNVLGTVYSSTAARQLTLVGLRAGGTEALPSAVQTNYTLLRLGGRGHDGTSIHTSMGAWIDLVAAETWTPTARGSRITVNTTTAGTTTQVERLKIDGNGDLSTWGGLCGLGTPLTATLGSGASYQALSVKGSTLYVGQSSVQERPMGLVDSTWATSTDASRKARLTLSVYDHLAAREGLRLEADGAAARLGFYGSAAVAKPSVTGSRGGNAALASLLTALNSLGLVTDSSTA